MNPGDPIDARTYPDGDGDGDSFARAVINILEDADSERDRLQLTHRAMLNILDDFEDTTNRLQQANHELTMLDGLKSEFVAMASHELRTPLTSITGFSSTMLSRWQFLSEADKYEFVGIIDGQSHRLARLVEGLLTISRIESGALRTNKSSIHVGMALRQTVRDLGVDQFEIDCADHLRVEADRDHFQQVIVNLVSNALAHGAAPFRIEADAYGADVKICVVDCGPGVPRLFVPHLFERFAQASGDASRSSPDASGKGSGLGLSIVHALVMAQGGEVWHEPNRPTGSRFCVRLPMSVAPVGQVS